MLRRGELLLKNLSARNTAHVPLERINTRCDPSSSRLIRSRAKAEQTIHIHEFGDRSAPDATSAGGHYNSEGHEHGLLSPPERHAGDLVNLKTGVEGIATLKITVDNITIDGSKNPILGRGVIVDAKLDNEGLPVGNAGARVACGVIGWADPAR